MSLPFCSPMIGSSSQASRSFNIQNNSWINFLRIRNVYVTMCGKRTFVLTFSQHPTHIDFKEKHRKRKKTDEIYAYILPLNVPLQTVNHWMSSNMRRFDRQSQHLTFATAISCYGQNQHLKTFFSTHYSTLSGFELLLSTNRRTCHAKSLVSYKDSVTIKYGGNRANS